MSLLLFFNDLSCGTASSPDVADAAMSEFVNVLGQVRQVRRDAAMISAAPLKDLELAPGYFLQQWLGKSPRHVEQMRKIRSMRQQAPFKAVLPEGIGDDVEYSIDGSVGLAIAGSHLLDGLLVSLPVSPRWSVDWISADRRILAPGPMSEVVIVADVIKVRHASHPSHVAFHDQWIRQVGIDDLRTGSELWEARSALYPNLLFLPATEKMLRQLNAEWLLPVANELRRIDDSIGDWNPTAHAQPLWRSCITPDSETNKRHCWFKDFDDQMRLFDLHGRFTPGAGRLHFRLLPEEGKATVAYIGRKLGI